MRLGFVFCLLMAACTADNLSYVPPDASDAPDMMGVDGMQVTAQDSGTDTVQNHSADMLKADAVLNSADMTTLPSPDMTQPADMKPAIPRTGLVLELLFNGDTTDTSGHGNNAVNHSAGLTIDRHNNGKAAYYFNGISSYMEVPEDASLDLTDNFTISAWVSVFEYGTNRMGIVSKYRTQNSPPGYDLRISGTQAPMNTLDLDEAGFHVTSGSSAGPSTETWHHILGVVSQGIATVYVDGVVCFTGTTGYWSAANTDPLGIGIDYTLESNRLFWGSIDDIRIYNRVLSQNEISILANE